MAGNSQMTFTPERWYEHQLLMLSNQLRDATAELRVLRAEKVLREVQFQTKSCWLCKRDVIRYPVK